MRTALLLLDREADELDTEDYAIADRWARLIDAPDYYSELDWDELS